MARLVVLNTGYPASMSVVFFNYFRNALLPLPRQRPSLMAVATEALSSSINVVTVHMLPRADPSRFGKPDEGATILRAEPSYGLEQCPQHAPRMTLLFRVGRLILISLPKSSILEKLPRA